MSLQISLPDTLCEFLREQMQMRGFASLDASAAYLLEQAQQLMPLRRTVQVDGQTYQLTRLTDWLETELWGTTIAVQPATGFQVAFSWRSELNLAETYAVCRHLFGERGRGFDDWKGGFAFPFALDPPRATRRPAYMFRVVNYRSGVSYDLRRIVESGDSRLENPIEYPPDEAEFSRQEIDTFTNFFVGFLEGSFEVLKASWNDQFLLEVESNLILYGFDGVRFFTRQFQSPTTYERTRNKLAQRLPTPGFYPVTRGIERLIW
jgi:hypothetical protein